MVGREVAEVLILIVCLEPEVPEVEPEPLLAAAADEEVPHVVAVEEGHQGHRQGGRHTQPGHTPSVTNLTLADCTYYTHLSTAIFLISDLANDSGILQS